MDDFNKRRALINIFVNSIYLYDDHFTLIINASKKPLSVDNIPLNDIEDAFEGENEEKTEGKEGCSLIATPVPPKKIEEVHGTSSIFFDEPDSHRTRIDAQRQSRVRNIAAGLA